MNGSFMNDTRAKKNKKPCRRSGEGEKNEKGRKRKTGGVKQL